MWDARESGGLISYDFGMTELLEHAVERLRALPPKVQDELARVILELAGEELPAVDLTPEDEASFQKSFEQAQRGHFATDEQVRAIWAKYGL